MAASARRPAPHVACLRPEPEGEEAVSDTIRVRCMRCGNWHAARVGEAYAPELCHGCWSKHLERDWDTARFVARYHRNRDGHPTWRLLQKTWADAGY